MIKSRTQIIPFKKPPKVKALSPIIPRRKKSEETRSKKSLFSTIIPFNPEMLRLEEVEQKHYIVPTPKIEYIIDSDDKNDWNSLLERFNSLMRTLLKVLSNMRKQQHRNVISLKLTEREIERRHTLLHEKLLEKTQDAEEVQAKTQLTDKEKIQKLKDYLSALGYAAAGALMVDPNAPVLTGNLGQKSVQLAQRLMQDFGLTDFQAAAIVGVMRREGFSSGYPDVRQGNVRGAPTYGGTSQEGYGWIQWTNVPGGSDPNGRLNRALIYLGMGPPPKQTRPWTDEDNYKVLTWEWRTHYTSTIPSVKSTSTLEQAVYEFVGNYTAGSKANIATYEANEGGGFLQRRIDEANSVLKTLRQKASGGIVIPELFDNNLIEYDTFRKTTLLSNFIVDRPTILNMKDIGEPLVIIPLGRPIGRMILQTIFRDAFRRLENKFEMKKIQSQPVEFLKTPAPTPMKSEIGGPSPATPGSSEIGGPSPATPVTPSVNTSTQSLSSMSIEQLKGMLDPTITGAANPSVFNAAKSAREAAMMQGLSPEEIERQVLMATIAARRMQPSPVTLVKSIPGKIINTVVPLPVESPEAKVPDISPSPQAQEEKSRIDTNISQKTENIITGGSKKVIMVNETYIYTD